MPRSASGIFLALVVAITSVGTPTPLLADPGDVQRLAGDNRVDTAVQVSSQTFPSADTAVIATAANFPDALSGAVLAAAVGGPLLLSERDRVPATVLGELDRLGVERVVMLGGTSALSASVEATLVGRGLAVDRLRGDDRYGTALAVADAVTPTPDRVVIVTGERFADAVSVSAYAAANGWPILMTPSTRTSPAVRAWLAARQPADAIIVGGPAAVSEAVAAAYDSDVPITRRLWGSDRYATSHAVARAQGGSPTSLWVATGADFPDALSAGAAAASIGAVLMLTPSPTTDVANSSVDVRALVEAGRSCSGDGALETATLVGGQRALATTVRDELVALLTCKPFPVAPGPCDPANPDWCVPLGVCTPRVRVSVDERVPALFQRITDEGPDQQVDTAVEIMMRSGHLPRWVATSDRTGQSFRDYVAVLRDSVSRFGPPQWPGVLTLAYHEAVHAAQRGLTDCEYGTTDSLPRAIVHDEMHARIDAAVPDEFAAELMHSVVDSYLADEASGHCDVPPPSGCFGATQGFASLLREINAYGHEGELAVGWSRQGVDSQPNPARAVLLGATSAYLARLRTEAPHIWDALRADGQADQFLYDWDVNSSAPFDDPAVWDVAYGAHLDAVVAFTDGRAASPAPRPAG